MSGESRLTAVAVNLDADLKLGSPQPLFMLQVQAGGPMDSIEAYQPQYDVAPDRRFLAAIVQPQVEAGPPVTVWLNATAVLRQDAPH